MRTWIELPPSLDVGDWGRRHEEGLVPDATPYGLGRLAALGHEVAFRPAPRVSRTLPARAVSRVSGLQWTEAATSPPPGGTDVCLSWDERTGIPRAALSRPDQAVVTGVIWLDDPGAYPLSRKLVRRLARCSLVWVLSSAQVPRLVSMGVPSDRLEYLPFGVDCEFFRPRPMSEVDPDLLVSVGNDRHRDWNTLLGAFVRLRARRSSAQLEVVTETSLPPVPGLRRRPRATHAELSDLYARSSAVVLATRPNFHVSGMTAALEAQATARPVIMSRTPGAEDYVAHGSTGWLVTPNDEAALAAQMESALDGAGSFVADAGPKGREAVERVFNTADQADRIAALLRRYC